MKKTVIINISGIVFHIDEDAYEKLKAYLDSLNHYFGNTAESREIITDIESRIAELLQPKISPNKQSISIEDVEEILSILGSPEDIAASDSTSYEAETATGSYPGKQVTRRLYRDLDNSTIGGVCSGLGAYFDVDPIIFKIIFIALIFAGGVSFIIYPILWIVVPAARTSAQKLEMRGKDINVSNIEKTVREELNHIQSNMSKPDSTWNRISDFIREFFNFLGVFLRGVLHVLRYVLGAFLIIMAIFFSIALIGALYFKNFAVHGEFNEYFSSVQDILYGIISPLNADTLVFLLFIILVLPIAGLIYLGLKLLIRFQARQRWIVLILSVIWILSVISFVILLFNEADNFRSEGSVRETITLTPSSNNILYIDAPATVEKDDDFIEFFSHSRLFFPLTPGKKEDMAGVIKVDIEKTNSSVPELQIVREARGETNSEAIESAKTITVSYNQKDSLLSLDPFFRISNDERWKFYSTKIIVRIPVGTKIFIDESTKHLLHNVRNVNDYWDEQMINKTWIMTENGLELVGSSNSEVIPLSSFGNKILNIQLRDRFGIDRDKLYRYNDGDKYGTINYNGNSYYYGTIDLDIRKSQTDKVMLELVKTSWSSGSREAESVLRTIEYEYQQNDSVLWIDPIFRFPEAKKWNAQNLKVIVRLPINHRVYLQRELEPLIEDMASENNNWTGNYVNNTWKMENDGLVKIE